MENAKNDLESAVEKPLVGEELILVKLRKKIEELESKNEEANQFIIEIAKLLDINTDSVGYDGIKLCMDDFSYAIGILKTTKEDLCI